MRGGKRGQVGGKRGHGGSGSGPGSGQGMFKKRKMSKKFWQQRKTSEMAPIPKDESDQESSDSEGEEASSQYDNLLDLFGAASNPGQVIGSDPEEESGPEEEQESSDDEKEKVEEQSSDEEEEEKIEEEEGSDDLEETSEEKYSQEDQTGGPQDPFVAKYELEIPADLKKVVEQKEMVTDIGNWSSIERFSVQVPNWQKPRKAKRSPRKKVKALLDANDDEDEEDENVSLSQATLITDTLKSIQDPEDFYLKEQLKRNLDVDLDPLQLDLLSILSSYKDLCFTQRTHDQGERIRYTYTLHCLNHILKTRTKIVNNNARLAKLSTKESLAANVRDQGLVRPKILMVVPFKESAKRIVDMMIKLLYGDKVKGGSVSNRKRFEEDFGHAGDRDRHNKSDDYYDTFAGNIDDGFKIGLAVTKKTLKLFTDFYSSDIIIASPLGLRMVIGVDGEDKRDHDFLASIEVLVMDQMDIFAMQNWDHVGQIMDNLHLQPSKSHGVDFSRVRMWTLNGMAHMYRQTLMFSSIAMPEMNAIFNKNCWNYCGKIKTANAVVSGTICSVAAQVPMIFHRFATDSLQDSVEDRFKYFRSKIMPEFKKDLMYHTLVFVPSYFDFVRVRNWFNQADLDFADVCEYSRDNNIAKARDQFFHSEKHFLLYTERSHFYRRFAIKGIRHLIFYQPPMYPHFYAELCNLMQAAFQNRKGGSDGNMTCTILYSKYDVHRLAGVVSTERAATMLQAEKNVHMLVPGTN